jgi:hypothetical protein
VLTFAKLAMNSNFKRNVAVVRVLLDEIDRRDDYGDGIGDQLIEELGRVLSALVVSRGVGLAKCEQRDTRSCESCAPISVERSSHRIR